MTQNTPTFREMFLPGLFAGLINGVIIILIVFSFAALMFKGATSAYFEIGAGYFLIGAVVICGTIALFSVFKSGVGLPQDNPVALAAVVMVVVSEDMTANGATPESIFYTAIMGIMLTSVLTGIAFWIVGHFKLGAIVKYVPYPIIGGILAGTGWLLLEGSIGIMADVDYHVDHTLGIFQAEILQYWLPGIVLGLILLLALNRFGHFLVLPLVLAVAALGFYGILAITETSVEQAVATGWLIEPLGTTSLYTPLDLGGFTSVSWLEIVHHLTAIGSIILITLVSMLLNVTALESAFQKSININKELKLLGYANIVAGLFGSLPGYHALSLSTIGLKTGGNTRIVGIIAAALCAATLFLGAGLLAFIPKFILGGMLAFIAFAFLYEWVFLGWKHLSRIDFFIVIAVVVAVEFEGLLNAISFGFLLSTILFMVDYSRTSNIRLKSNATNYHSLVERSQLFRDTLDREGERVLILALRGYIFFGSATKLRDEIEQHIAQPDSKPLEYLLFDFEDVSGLDGSALHEFVKIQRLAAEHQITVVFSALSQRVIRTFESETFLDGSPLVEHIYPSLDEALEWCETQILLAIHGDIKEKSQNIEAMVGDAKFVAPLMAYLESVEFAADEYVYREGEEAKVFYYITSGLVREEQQRSDGSVLRVRTVGPGKFIGHEVTMRTPRYATCARAETKLRLLQLSEAQFNQLKREKPELTLQLFERMTGYLAERMVQNTHLISDILAKH